MCVRCLALLVRCLVAVACRVLFVVGCVWLHVCCLLLAVCCMGLAVVRSLWFAVDCDCASLCADCRINGVVCCALFVVF